jgi:DNA-binding NarL/FixJ family response regulator
MEQYKICGAYSCAEDALSSIALKQCDILISDISLPGMNGLELIEKFIQINPYSLTMVVSMHISAYYITRAKELNVDAYVSKRDASTRLLQALEVIEHGGLFYEDIDNDDNLDVKEFEVFHELTEREKEVFLLLARGNEVKRVASVLDMAISTVHVHRRNVMQKLDLAGSFQMTKFALKHGLLVSDSL